MASHATQFLRPSTPISELQDIVISNSRNRKCRDDALHKFERASGQPFDDSRHGLEMRVAHEVYGHLRRSKSQA